MAQKNPPEPVELTSFEVRSVAKQLNAEAADLSRNLRGLLATVEDLRSVLFGTAQAAKARERLAASSRTCGAPGRRGARCRRRASEPGGRCSKHGVSGRSCQVPTLAHERAYDFGQDEGHD